MKAGTLQNCLKMEEYKNNYQIIITIQWIVIIFEYFCSGTTVNFERAYCAWYYHSNNLWRNCPLQIKKKIWFRFKNNDMTILSIRITCNASSSVNLIQIIEIALFESFKHVYGQYSSVICQYSVIYLYLVIWLYSVTCCLYSVIRCLYSVICCQ